MQQTAITHKMQSIGWAAKWNIKEEGACVNSADRDYSERERERLFGSKEDLLYMLRRTPFQFLTHVCMLVIVRN